MFLKNGSAIRRLASLHWLQLGAVRQFQRYYQDAMTPCRHPTALRFLRLVVPRFHSFLSLLGGRVHRRGLELVTRYLQPGICREANRVLPSSWGTPSVRLRMFFDSGRTACTRPIWSSSMALGMRKTKAPTTSLSKLNSMAFGLAVYASWCGLLQPHARLPSSRWSDAAGWAFHPQGSYERFQSSLLTCSSSSPKLLGAIPKTRRMGRCGRNRPDSDRNAPSTEDFSTHRVSPPTSARGGRKQSVSANLEAGRSI